MARHSFILRWSGEPMAHVHLRDARNNTYTLGGIVPWGRFSFLEITSNYFCIYNARATPIYRIVP